MSYKYILFKCLNIVYPVVSSTKRLFSLQLETAESYALNRAWPLKLENFFEEISFIKKAEINI